MTNKNRRKQRKAQQAEALAQKQFLDAAAASSARSAAALAREAAAAARASAEENRLKCEQDR